MSDEFDALAHEVIDRWYKDGNDFKPNWRKSWAPLISSALLSAVKREREAILEIIAAASVDPGDLVERPSYTKGDMFETYFTGISDFKFVVRSAIRARGNSNDK